MTVCNLAVNSVLQSLLVKELEGSGGAMVFDWVSHTICKYSGMGGKTQSNIALCELQMSEICNFVKTWLLDKIQENSNTPATLAIEHFWHWI